MEPYYKFMPSETIVRVDEDGNRRRLVPPKSEIYGTAFHWGYAGKGPNLTAEALLRDATITEVDGVVAMGFVSDILDYHELTESPWGALRRGGPSVAFGAGGGDPGAVRARPKDKPVQ